MSRSIAITLALSSFALALPSYTNCTESPIITAPATASSSSVRTAGNLLPTTTPASSTATLDLSTSVLNQDLLSVDVGDDALSLRCVDCSTSGSLEVLVHDDENDLWRRKRDLSDIDWPGPSGSLVARFPTGLHGKAELSLNAPKTVEHEFEIIKLPTFGLMAPGLGVAGATASLVVPLELEMAGEAELTFGFNFSVPGNASLAVEFPLLDESTSLGFRESQGLRMDSLPVTLSVPGLDVQLTTGLRLKLEVEVETEFSDDDNFIISTGASLDLPRIEVRERQLVNVDETCHRLAPNISTAVHGSTISSSNVTWSNITDPFDKLLGDYTHIAPSIGVALDLFAEVGMKVDFDVDLFDMDFAKSTDWEIFSTAWPLPTQCIDNSPATTSMAVVEVTSALPTHVVKVAEPTATVSGPSTALPVAINDAVKVGGCTMSFVLAVAWMIVAL